MSMGPIIFPDDLKLRALRADEGPQKGSSIQWWELVAPFSMNYRDIFTITVPAGTVSDFASVPRLAKWYVDDDDPCILNGSIIHDYVYSLGGCLPDQFLSREFADHMLAECMMQCGASSTKAWLVEKAVRLGGGKRWAT